MDSVYQMRCKTVVSGDVVEMYFYRVPIECNKKSSPKKETVVSTDDRAGDKRQDNLLRARKNVRQIIWSNQGQYTKFVTLTYSQTVLDVKKVKRDITTFVQSMRRKGYDMKYLYVLENQKQRGQKENNAGCLHVHMLIFIDKFIKLEDLRKSWKHGFVGIEIIDDVKNLGAYVCKYITKENLAEFGKRTFSCSIGLNRPSEERFYTLGFSDSDVDFAPEEVLKAIDIEYHSSLRHDYINSFGEVGMQVVEYYQGKWKNGNVIKERDPMYQFEKRLKDEYDFER